MEKSAFIETRIIKMVIWVMDYCCSLDPNLHYHQIESWKNAAELGLNIEISGNRSDEKPKMHDLNPQNLQYESNGDANYMT